MRRRFSRLALVATGVAGGLVIAAVIYVAILLIGAVLFKKTADQSVTLDGYSTPRDEAKITFLPSGDQPVG